MNKHARISGLQLTALLFAARLSNCLLLTPTAPLNLTDRLLSIALSGVLLFLLFVPTILLLRRSGGSVVDAAYRRSRLLGRSVCGWYVAVCLFILCLDLVQFYDFAEKAMNSRFSVGWLTVSLVAVAFAAAFYGIEALARTAQSVALFSAVCLAVFALALLPEMRAFHFPPTAHSGVGSILRAAVEELPRTAETVSVGLLYSHVDRGHARALGAFSALTSLFTALVVTTSLGVLGDFASVTAYPYYTAVSAAQIGVFQRLDSVVTAVWLATFFVRVTLFCSLLLRLVGRTLGKRARPLAALAGTLLLSGFTLLIRAVRDWSFITAVYVGVLAVCCLLLPAVLGLVKRKEHP